MENLNRFRLRPSHVITHKGQSFFITDLRGFVAGGIEGFYYRQTRFLSKIRVTVDGKEPSSISANTVESHRTISYYLAPSPAGASAGPEPDAAKGDSEIVRHAIELQICSFVGDGLHLDVDVTNHGLAPASVELCWELDADFADRSEAEQGKRQQNAPVERRWEPDDSGGKLSFHYRHPQLLHGTEIHFSALHALTDKSGAIAFGLQLRPQQSVSFTIDVAAVFCGDRATARHGADTIGGSPMATLRDRAPQMRTNNSQVQRVWDRAVSDLSTLALLEGEGEERLTPAGGVPKYIALFGRDVLMTGFQASLVAPAMLRGSLRQIAKWNATEYDERFDMEPGRVIHQRELGPLSLLKQNPFLHYYGDYSAPGLFLIDMAWDLALTGDKPFFRSMQDKMLATLEWMDRDGDRDKDGFYEYDTKAGSWGEKNQGWKDSSEAILYEDGRLVKNPITLVEIQGCYFAAKQLLALAFASLGDEHRAADLLAQAEQLKRRFNETFWMPQAQYFGLALDPAKTLVKTIAADPGQCLAYGIVDDDKAEAVAARLMMPDMFSGWGIRTLSDRHPAFNPFAYHLGTVWPSANAIIGFGLKRYGFNQQLHHLAKAIFDAAELFEFDRLPEVFGGHARDCRHPHPGIYPDANSPQSWSASAVILLVTSMLGLIPVAPRQTLIIDPDLPEWLPELTLTNMQIGNARVKLHFQRDATGCTHHEVIEQHGELHIRRPPPGNVPGDRFARYLQEVISR